MIARTELALLPTAAGSQIVRRSSTIWNATTTGDHLEDVRDAAGGQRQRGHEHEQHDRDGEALLAEGLTEGVERLRPVALQPVVELADRTRIRSS